MRKLLLITALGIVGSMNANVVDESRNKIIDRNDEIQLPKNNKNLNGKEIIESSMLVGDSWFCQRKSDETSNQCYMREVKEFTSDTVGAIAWATNGSNISLLITAMCSCSESSTPVKKTESIQAL